MMQPYSSKEQRIRQKIVKDYLRNFQNNSTATASAIADAVLTQFMAVRASSGIRPDKDASPYYFNGTQVLVVGPVCENPKFAGFYNFLSLKADEIDPDPSVFIGRKADELKVDSEDMVFLEDLIRYNTN